MKRIPLAALAIAAALACGGSSAPQVRGAFDPQPFGGVRPTTLYVPTGYSDAAPAPLVFLLHGYGANGKLQESLFKVQAAAEARGMLYARPDGLTDSTGSKYWNATDACCDFDTPKPDDSKYLSDLVAEIRGRYVVDPKRIYFIGHSNGGFMSYRMACDHADLVAGIMSLAGETWLDTSKCAPSKPVAVLQVQGTADLTILYDGGTTVGGSTQYPGALQTVATWAAYNGCSGAADTSAPMLDLESFPVGPDTSVLKYASGCKGNGQVELWTIKDAGHIPAINASFTPAVLDWLLAHPKG